jgi:PPOX class probable F420-dependent enzyme
MMDFNSPIGEKIIIRLKQEHILWLTSVDAKNTPQPRPVWFTWDGETVLVFSQPDAAKIRHIRRNPRTALNFNTSPDGGDVGVLIGTAEILPVQPSPQHIKAYLEKYEQGIRDIGVTIDEFRKEYSVAIRITPESVRGF